MSIEDPLIGIKNADQIQLMEMTKQLFLNEIYMKECYGVYKGLDESDVKKLFDQIINKIKDDENI